jgi:DNA-binding NarL/FixJ family response regulator
MNEASGKIPTVVVVEDEWLVAKDLEQSLRRAGFSVLGFAASGTEALAQIERHQPTLVVIDIGLQGELDGIQVASRLRAMHDTPVVYVTGRVDDATLERASATNVMGYVVKPFDERQLRSAALLAVRRTQHLSRTAHNTTRRNHAIEDGLQAIAKVLRDVGVTDTGRWEAHPDVATLSRRELDIMRRLVNNARVPEIARVMRLSPHTVRNHLKAVFRKLGVHSQSELIEWTRARCR